MRILLPFMLLVASCAAPQKTPDAAKPADEAMTEAVVVEQADEFVVLTTEVEFGDPSVRGELIRPQAQGAVPSAIIVHDWGVSDRDGGMQAMFGVGLPSEVPVYRALAESLAARGVAVLVFDRASATNAEDLRAAKTWLAGQEGVASVALIGHGFGAKLAATEHDGRVVLLHPMMGSIAALARFQAEESIRLIDARIAEVGDVPEADLLKQQRKELRAALDAGEVIELDADAAAYLAELDDRFMAAIAGRDEVLVIEATVDPGEPKSESELRQTQFGNRVVRVDGLSRAMVSVGEDDDPTVVSSEVVNAVSAFLRAAN